MRNNFPMLRERYAVVAGLRVGGSLFLITLLFFAGCNPGGNNNISTTDSTKIQTTGADTGKGKDKAAMALIGAPLCIYYTDATTMYNLILKNPGPQGAARGKIVFQYFITKNDTLTLSAFSGEQHGQNYDVTSHMIILNASKSQVGHIPGNLFLADQELCARSHPDPNTLQPLLDEIKRHAGSPAGTYEGYIAFAPTLIPFDNPAYSTIHYEVRWYATIDDINKISSFTSITGADVNPSPPRNAY